MTLFLKKAYETYHKMEIQLNRIDSAKAHNERGYAMLRKRRKDLIAEMHKVLATVGRYGSYFIFWVLMCSYKVERLCRAHPAAGNVQSLTSVQKELKR